MKYIKRLIASALFVLLFVQLTINRTWAQSGHKNLPAQQLMVVLTNDWSSLQGHLYAFNKQHGKWVLQFDNEVVVGAKGLGVGDGSEPVTISGAPQKREGDLKAPAGIFTIGTAFGYADAKDASWIKKRYVKATDTLICVDDKLSAHYNTLISDTGKTDYHSFENMHRKDDYYKWGLFINHNAGNTISGDGSCIFMHIWKNNQSGTEGCTAMQETNLLRVLHWIDAAKNPLLVQLPTTDYKRLRQQYSLPEID